MNMRIRIWSMEFSVVVSEVAALSQTTSSDHCGSSVWRVTLGSMPRRARRVKWQLRGLCSVTPCVQGHLTLRPVTWNSSRCQRLSDCTSTPYSNTTSEGGKKALRPTGFYFMLYLPVLPVLWAMLSFGIQDWSNPRAIFPSTMCRVALTGLLRDVKRGQYTALEHPPRARSARDVLKGR